MAKMVKALILAALICCPAVMVSADNTGDEAMLQQLSPENVAKWNSATAEQQEAWRTRWQMDSENGTVTAAPPKKSARAAGTLQYDTGAPADLWSTNGGNTDQAVGNRMTGTASVGTSFTVTAVSLYGRSAAATADPFDPGFTFFNPPTGTAAVNIGYRGAATNAPQSSFAPVPLSPINVPNNFLAAMYQGTFAGSDEIGMVTDSSGGAGFHAFQVDFASITSTGYAAIPGQNAMLRVLGTGLVPVELMSFMVE